MTPDKPTTRTQADEPDAVAHLSTADQTALELSGEIEHAAGLHREKLDQKSRELSGEDKENGGRE